MAQYGRRMRLQRMYDDGSDELSERGSAGVPGYIPTDSTGKAPVDVTQYEAASKNHFDEMVEALHKRLKLVEDKSVMMDTTSRRVALEGDAIKRRLQEIEHDTQRTTSDLTTGLERSLRGAADAKRDVEACKDWSQTYVSSQLAQHEQVVKSTFGNELTNLSMRQKQLQEAVSNSSARFDTALKLMQESTRNHAMEHFEKQAMKLQALEGLLAETLKKNDVLEQHFADTLEVAIGRERSARERDVLERDRIMQQLSQSCSATVEREVGAEIKKTAEFAETSLQRMDAIERLLKVEIRNRMDLAGSHDRLVDDVRKIERNTIASITQIETALQDKVSELAGQMTQQAASQREALNTLQDVSKKAVTTLQTSLHTELQELRGFLLKKTEANSQALAELSQKVHHTTVKSDETERLLTESRAQQERDSKEMRSMLTRSENKLTEELSAMSGSLQDFCSKQLQGSIKEALQREQALKDSCAAEIKRTADELNVLKRNEEKDMQEVRKLVYDKNNETQEEVKGNLDRLTTLIQKTDEISRLQLDKSHEMGLQIDETRQMIDDSADALNRKVAAISSLDARQREDNEQRVRDITDLKLSLKQGVDCALDTVSKKHKETVDTERRTREELLNEISEVGRRAGKKSDELADRTQKLEDALDEKERHLKRRAEEVAQQRSDEDEELRRDITSLRESVSETKAIVAEVNERELKIGNDVRKELLSVTDQITDVAERQQRANDSVKLSVAEVRRTADGNRVELQDVWKEVKARGEQAMVQADKKAKEEEVHVKREKFLKEEITLVVQSVSTLTDRLARLEVEKTKDDTSSQQLESSLKRELQGLADRVMQVEREAQATATELGGKTGELRTYVDDQVLMKLQRTDERFTKKTQIIEAEMDRRRETEHDTKKECTQVLASLNDIKVTLQERYDLLDRKVDQLEKHSMESVLQSSRELNQQIIELSTNTEVARDVDKLSDRVIALETSGRGEERSAVAKVEVEALRRDLVELRNELGERVLRGELDVVARKLVALDADCKGSTTEREHQQQQLARLLDAEKDRLASDSQWDEWRDTVSLDLHHGKRNALSLLETQESCHRQFLHDDELNKRKMYIIESDSRIEAEAYEELVEKFHQRERAVMGRRLSSSQETPGPA
eukprot:TRINITY_DN19834_c0_g1_i1.p1 TRINITY_DN19834_c0_g1~~TRINITY_DN19834_c0_g1_i1.p1  ORF type:complete len:1155 (+),score=505.63 TRINITY_DN19834_c0_g1_i1:39-3467(+)